MTRPASTDFLFQLTLILPRGSLSTLASVSGDRGDCAARESHCRLLSIEAKAAVPLCYRPMRTRLLTASVNFRHRMAPRAGPLQYLATFTRCVVTFHGACKWTRETRLTSISAWNRKRGVYRRGRLFITAPNASTLTIRPFV